MTNQNLLQDMTTQDTALMTKHTSWAAAQSGKEAWIIDSENTPDGDNWFTYTTDNIARMRQVRKIYCARLREGNTL